MDLVSIPQDLSLVPDQELTDLEAAATEEFDSLDNADEITPASLERMQTLTAGIDRVKGEKAARKARAEADAEAAKFQLEQQRATLKQRVHGEDGGTTTTAVLEGPAVPDTEAIAAAAARGATEALVRVFGERTSMRPSVASLSATQSVAPKPKVPEEQLAVTASVDIPGVASGSDLTFEGVVDAFQKRARALPIASNGDPGSGPRVVTIRNSFAHTVDDRTSAATMRELFNRLVNDNTKEALVAGGGWCAPSEVRYSFFNSTCTDGLIDLPTVGISRGGIRWPAARSLADVYTGTFTNATNPWLWTETDDALTVTGSTNKPCVRVPCPTFNESRLECYGICLTAGNLTDDAFPESTADYLRLLLAAHEHAMNARTISLMVSAASAIVTGADLNVDALPVTNQVLGAVSLAGVDYRAKLGLCDTEVLEVILPMWIRDMIRSDLAWRFNVDLLAVTDQYIDTMFRVRRIAPQFVGDWQVRGSNQLGNTTTQTVWPDTVDFLLYTAGTFIRGNGLTLDLGVVRDSVLNAENDHTAAWSEECHLVAMVGPEARNYRVAISVRGMFENSAAAFADRL